MQKFVLFIINVLTVIIAVILGLSIIVFGLLLGKKLVEQHYGLLKNDDDEKADGDGWILGNLVDTKTWPKYLTVNEIHRIKPWHFLMVAIVVGYQYSPVLTSDVVKWGLIYYAALECLVWITLLIHKWTDEADCSLTTSAYHEDSV